eukprot:16431959-Heterocapsa_arctica.AAC.1
MEDGLCHLASGMLFPPAAEPSELNVSSGPDGPMIYLAMLFPKHWVDALRQGSFLDELCRIPPSSERSSVLMVIWNLGQIKRPFFGLVRPLVPQNLGRCSQEIGSPPSRPIDLGLLSLDGSRAGNLSVKLLGFLSVSTGSRIADSWSVNLTGLCVGMMPLGSAW